MKNTSLIVSAVLWLCSCLSMMAAGNKVYVVQSPDKQLKVEISAGTDGLIYSVYHKDSLIVVDSKLGLIQEGKTPALAGGAKVISAKTKKIFQDIDAPFYRFKSFQAVCNEMNLKLKGEYGVYFRVYNEGVAYRFYTSSKEDLIIKNEIAEFRFAGDYTAYLPYSTNKEKPMAMAFQNTYEVKPLSEAPQEPGFFAGNSGLQAGEGDTAGVGLGSLSGNVCAAGWKAGIERCVCSLSEKDGFLSMAQAGVCDGNGGLHSTRKRKPYVSVAYPGYNGEGYRNAGE